MVPLTFPDLVLTGVPRGGTTLACRLLGQAPDTLALFEPMPVVQLPIEHGAAAAEVAAYFAMVRRRALGEGCVPSKHQQGHVPDNPYGERMPGQAARPWLVEPGDIAVGKPLSSAFRLVIKHNAAFTALLPTLAERWPVLGIVRHPLAVLASWHSVDLPVSRGRLPAGERLDPTLAAALSAQPDLLRRQVLILDWFFARLRRWVAPPRLLRYEDIVASGGRCLWQAAGLPAQSGAELASRNVSTQYDPALTATLAAALRTHAGASLTLYSAVELDALAERMSTRPHD